MPEMTKAELQALVEKLEAENLQLATDLAERTALAEELQAIVKDMQEQVEIAAKAMPSSAASAVVDTVLFNEKEYRLKVPSFRLPSNPSRVVNAAVLNAEPQIVADLLAIEGQQILEEI